MTDHAQKQTQGFEPRSGLLGELDKFIGPGATRAELLLQFGVALLAPILLLLYVTQNDLNWTPLQMLIGVIIALDIAGGVVTNATSAAKRWYHRAGQGFRQHVMFVGIHFLQPMLVVLFFRPGDWMFFGVVYGYLIIASLVIMGMPLYLQRPKAMIFLMGAFLIHSYVLTPTAGLEWFIPMFYTKLLISHLLPETAYLPEQMKASIK